MNKLNELKKHLKEGHVYRRTDLSNWSKSIDRHLEALIEDGTLKKLSQGIYYVPKETAFGAAPPEDDILVRSFLKDDRFLLTSLNAYNSLGVGTTQLYNERLVYNHKRHGDFKLGNRKFSFRIKPHFPKKITREFLLVDLMNNLETLAEDQQQVVKNVAEKVGAMDAEKLKYAVLEFGNLKAKKLLLPLIQQAKLYTDAN